MKLDVFSEEALSLLIDSSISLIIVFVSDEDMFTGVAGTEKLLWANPWLMISWFDE